MRLPALMVIASLLVGNQHPFAVGINEIAIHEKKKVKSITVFFFANILKIPDTITVTPKIFDFFFGEILIHK